MIIFVKVVFNLVLSISKTHLIVKLETFPHLRRARAGFGWGRGAVRPPPNSREGCSTMCPRPESDGIGPGLDIAIGVCYNLAVVSDIVRDATKRHSYWLGCVGY